MTLAGGKKVTVSRSCVVCGEKSEKSAMIRFVWRQEGPLEDPRQTANGRGAYVCHRPSGHRNLLHKVGRWKRVFRLQNNLSVTLAFQDQSKRA